MRYKRKLHHAHGAACCTDARLALPMTDKIEEVACQKCLYVLTPRTYVLGKKQPGKRVKRPPRNLSLLDRFQRCYVVTDDGCWRWTAGMHSHGYAAFRKDRAHRVAYELFVGPIPVGKVVDHVCHTDACPTPGPSCLHRRCVNPAHLKVCTTGENTRRSLAGPGPHGRYQRYLDGCRCDECSAAASAHHRERYLHRRANGTWHRHNKVAA